MQNFRALGAPPPDPRASVGWGLCPQTPIGLRRLPQTQPPPLRISGYAPVSNQSPLWAINQKIIPVPSRVKQSSTSKLCLTVLMVSELTRIELFLATLRNA